jgi:hypothetical protein
LVDLLLFINVYAGGSSEKMGNLVCLEHASTASRYEVVGARIGRNAADNRCTQRAKIVVCSLLAQMSYTPMSYLY